MLKKGVVLVSLLLLVLPGVFAVCSPPASGDWNVSSGTQACEDQEVVINGNVNFNGSAILSLANSNFSINSTTPNEFELNMYDTATLNATDSRFFIETDKFNMFWNDQSLLDFSSVSVSNQTITVVQGNATSTFTDSNFSEEINLLGNSTNTLQRVTLAQFDDGTILTVLGMEDGSSTTIANSTINGRSVFGSSTTGPTILVYSSSFNNNSEFRGSSVTNFLSASNITHVTIYSQTPTVNGSVNFTNTVPTNFLSTAYQRFYPVYVTDQNALPVEGAVVNITNSSGSKVWEGTTDSSGFVEANVNFTTSNYNLDFNISVNSTETLGLQTNTPISLTMTVSNLVPEFSDYALMLALVLTISGFVAIRKRK